MAGGLDALGDDDNMFRPPVNRAMRALDRPFFQKTIPLAAARVLQAKNIAKCRTDLHDELLKLERVSAVKQDQQRKDSKVLLLKPEIRPDSKRPYAWNDCDNVY